MSSSPTSLRREKIRSRTVRDEARLEALRQYQILDTEPEPAFDRAAALAAHLFDAPTALVNFIEADRQWFKSTIGFAESETSLEESFCVYTLAEDDVFVVEDLSEEDEFADNSFVTDRGVRFYAGAPLITPDGHRLGTLCVLDTEPTSPSADTLNRFTDLAAMVMGELELRRERAEHKDTLDELEENRELLRQVEELADVGGAAYDLQSETLTWTEQTYRIFGRSPEEDVDLETAFEGYAPESRSVIRAETERIRDDGGRYELEIDAVTPAGERRRVRTIAEAQPEDGATTQLVGAVQDITEQYRDRRLQEMQSHFFERIAAGAPTDDLLADVAQFTDDELSGARVAILRRDGDRLYHAAGSSLPDALVDAGNGMEIGPDAAPCGAAVYQNRDVITDDLRNGDWSADVRAAAEQAGVRACHSTVIRGTDDTVLGTLAVYRDDPGRPTSAEHELADRMAHVAGVTLERERRERALRDSEERWRTLVTEHPGPIFVTVDGIFTYANAATAALVGAEDPEALTGTDATEFIHPEERERLQARIHQLMEDREATPLTEYRIVRPDGDERIVLAHSVPIRYRGEAAAQTMMWDVTDRKETERALRRSENKFRTVVENAQPVTFMIDRDGTFLLSEGEDLGALDLEPGDVVGESVYDVYGDHSEAIAAVDLALAGTPVDREVEVNGVIFDFWASPFYDDDGNVAGIIGMAADITERRQAQLDLQENYQRLRLALEAADAGTFEHDLASEQMYWDERAISLLGLDSDAQTCDVSTLKDLVLAEDVETLRTVFHQTIDSDASRYETSYRIRRPDNGDVRHIHSRGLILRDEDGTAERIIGVNQDVTERHRRKEALERQNDLFTKAQDIADVGAWEYDVPSETTTVTEKTYQIHGMEPGANIDPEHTIDLFHPDDQPVLQKAFRQAIREGTPYDLELRLTTPDEERKWVRTRGEPQTEDGEVVRLRGTIQNITARKEREQELRRQKNLLEQTQKLAGGWEIDLQAETVSWSEEVYRIHEVEPGTEVSIEEAIQFYTPEARPRLRDAYQACIDKEEPYDLELSIITAAGNRRWVRTVGAPVETRDGEVVKIAGAFQDITDRKEAEQNLRRSREQLSMAVEGGNIGTWNWNVETDEVFFNRRWAEMLGYTREELDFHFSTWEDLVHPEDLSRAMRVLEAYVEGDRDTYAPEIRMQTKTGDWKWIQTIGKVIDRDEDGTVTRVAGIHLDIDERKRAEIALREAKGRYQTLVEHFPDGGVALFDDDLRYTIAGGQELEKIGLSPADFEGSTPRDLFPAEVAEKTIAHYRRALEGDKDVFEHPLYGQHYRVQAVPVRDDDGNIIAGMAVAQNITERKKTRRRLERYREYTDRLLDSIDDLFFAIDEEAQLQRWNAPVPDVTGYSEDELDEMDAFNFVPEQEHEHLAAKIAEGFTAGSAQVELPVLRKDGTTVPYEFVGSLVEDPDGGLQIVGIGRDLTERKRKERLLRQADTFFQHAQDALFLIDVDEEEDEPTFVVERVNPVYEQATGLREKHIRGLSPRELLDEEGMQHKEAMYRTCVEERRPLEYEEDVSVEGTTTYWRTRIAPVVVDGEVEQIAGTTRNVTEHRRRKEALERQNDLFAKAQTIADIGGWEYNVRAGTYTLTQEAYRIHGLDPDADLPPERSIEFYHPDDRPTIRTAFKRAVAEGRSYDLELRLRRDDGDLRWVRTRGEPQTEHGEVVRVRGTIQDVTERVHRRQALKKAKDAAEKADRTKSALLSNMNHELRTPLTSIITFSKLIRDTPDVAERFAERILNGGHRLLHTLNTVMELAELEGDGISPDPEPIRLRDVAWSVVSHFRDRTGDEIALSVDDAADERAVQLDEHLTERILTHLVHNATKFTEAGTVTVSLRTGPEEAELTVTDPGIGIEPDVLPRVFDEFFQASSGDNRNYEGNGIGLTVVQRTVQQMGGTVDIESTPGDGTQVTVHLPVEQ